MFDLESAIAVRERPDGLLEKDTFDLSTAMPVETEIRAAKPGEIPYTPPANKAQANVELSYKQSGQEVPAGLRAEWILSSPQAKAITQTVIAPELSILQGIRGAIDNSGKYNLIDRVQKGILQSEDTKRFYEYIPKSEALPNWAKITANIGEDIVSLGALGLGKGLLRKELLTRNISRKLEQAATEFSDEAMTNYLPSGYKSEESVRQSLKSDFKNRLLGRLTAPEIPGATEGTLGTLGEEVSPSILQNYASRRSLFGLLREEIGAMGERGSVIIPKIGQTVEFTNPQGIVLKGVFKEITGQRAIIDMDGRQVVAGLSQLSLPEAPKPAPTTPQEAQGEAIAPTQPTGEGKVLYHGTSQESASDIIKNGFKITNKLNSESGISFSDSKNIAKMFAGKNGKVLESIISSDIKLMDGEKFDAIIQDLVTNKKMSYNSKPEMAIVDSIAAKEAKKMGYDGVDWRGQKYGLESNSGELRVWNTDKIKLSTPTGQKPPVEPPKTAVSGEPAPDGDKLFKDYVRATPVGKVITKAANIKQELANEDFLIKSYESDIAKLENQIKIEQFNTEAEKLKVQDKLTALKDKYSLAKETQRQKKAYRDEVAGLVKSITATPKENIAIEYQDMIEQLQSKFDLKRRTEATEAKRENMKAFVERMKVEGKTIDIPEDKLAMLDKLTLNEMTLDQLREVKATIDQLSKLGKTKLKAREVVYAGKKEKIITELSQKVSPINSKQLPETPIGTTVNDWVKRYINLSNYIQKTKVGLTAIEGFADITGMQDMKKALDKSFGTYLTYNDEPLTKWYEVSKDLNEGSLDRIGAKMFSMRKGGYQRLENSNYTKKQIDAIQLTPKEQEALDLAFELFESPFPKVKDFMKRVYNQDVGEADNYVSFISDNDLLNDLEQYEKFGNGPEEASKRLTKTTEKGFTKSTANVSKIKLQLNIDKVLRRHLDDVAYMLTMGEDIKMYYEIVNSPVMREKLGDVGTLAWLQWLDLMARKGGSEGAKRLVALDIIRRNVGAGVLAFRLSSALVQFSSFGDTMATIGAEWATRGATNIATSKEWRNFIMDNFPEVKKAVGDDIAFREFGEGILDKVSRFGLTPLQFLDGVMRSTAVSGSYEKLCAERGIAVDLNNPNPDLIQEATKMMRQSQGSSFFKDQPLSLTTGYGLLENRSLNKTALTFQSFMLSRWDNINRQIWRLGIKEKNYAKAGFSALWLLIFGFAAEEGLRRGSRKILNMVNASPRKENNFMSEVGLNAIQSVPLLGQLVSSINYSSNPVPVIKTVEDIIGGAGSLVKGKAIETKLRGLIRALGGIGSLSGVAGSSSAAQILRGFVPKADKKAYW